MMLVTMSLLLLMGAETRSGLAGLEAKLEAQQAALYRRQNRLLVAVLVSIVGGIYAAGVLA